MLPTDVGFAYNCIILYCTIELIKELKNVEIKLINEIDLFIIYCLFLNKSNLPAVGRGHHLCYFFIRSKPVGEKNVLIR